MVQWIDYTLSNAEIPSPYPISPKQQISLNVILSFNMNTGSYTSYQDYQIRIGLNPTLLQLPLQTNPNTFDSDIQTVLINQSFPTFFGCNPNLRPEVSHDPRSLFKNKGVYCYDDMNVKGLTIPTAHSDSSSSQAIHWASMQRTLQQLASDNSRLPFKEAWTRNIAEIHCIETQWRLPDIDVSHLGFRFPTK